MVDIIDMRTSICAKEVIIRSVWNAGQLEPTLPAGWCWNVETNLSISAEDEEIVRCMCQDGS